MTKGAFQISRDIFNNDIWDDVPKFRIFFYILGNAVFSEDGIKHAGIKLERGQYLRSLRGLRDDLAYKEGRGNAIKKYPLTTIQRKIKSLVNEERITVKSTEYGTLFTVVNYALYQGLSNYKKSSVEQQRNSDGTATEQQRNNNKNVKECSKNVKEEYTSKIKDLLSHFSSIKNFNSLSKQYWDVIRETRTHGKVAESVIYKNMKKWIKYDAEVVEYALKEHINNHKGKKEEYTIGIMRGTTKEDALDRLNNPFTNKQEIDWEAL